MKQLLIGAAILAATIATGAAAQEVSLARFFGACEDAGVDTKASVGEACIIQSIINAASAGIPGVTVGTLPTDWGNYYGAPRKIALTLPLRYNVMDGPSLGV